MRDDLANLKKNFSSVVGKEFNYFFCPFLYTDENVELCRGHVINQAFSGSPTIWTMQRKDVDTFFGSNFESDFVKMEHKKSSNLGEVISSKELSKKLRPKFFLNAKEVDYFLPTGYVPTDYSLAEFDNEGQILRVGIKMSNQDIAANLTGHWEVGYQLDLRIPAMVSVIKSAYLTLFALLGYNYALSSGAYYVGHKLLGRFFLANKGNKKKQVVANAIPYFRYYGSMFRPVLSNPMKLMGTITDKVLFICETNKRQIWAYLIFVKTGNDLAVAMLPHTNGIYQNLAFEDFLNSAEETIMGRWAKLTKIGWEMDRNISSLNWIKKGMLYPNGN